MVGMFMTVFHAAYGNAHSETYSKTCSNTPRHQCTRQRTLKPALHMRRTFRYLCLVHNRCFDNTQFDNKKLKKHVWVIK
jgi:hypothetical protein